VRRLLTNVSIALAFDACSATGGAAPLPRRKPRRPATFRPRSRNGANSVRLAVVQVTNMPSQVAPGAKQLQVSLPDKRSFPATMVGEDPQTDLAVVQISDDNLPITELGASSNMQLGAWVVAIGNALALPGGPTVTQGLVSATGPADSITLTVLRGGQQQNIQVTLGAAPTTGG
jgi:S1-C subfamily serine protease